MARIFLILVILLNSVLGTAIVNNHILDIVSQDGDTLYVPNQEGQVSLFSDPSIGNNTIGLLAHKHLAGRYFYELDVGDRVFVFSKIYKVAEIEYFDETESHTLIRKSTGEEITYSELFTIIYRPENRLILQTCTDTGLVFIIGYPMKTYTIYMPMEVR